ARGVGDVYLIQVWWETQIDPSIVFGIPQVTCVASPEGYVLENTQLEPDILVGNTPEDVLSGTDRQISRAVQEMLGK
ncbi:MAG: hypothetical protein K2M76_06205, partial [Muribaculaceae bacterium]|nr:hypothetical protein [Muribaculaceae bacterium]